MSQLKRYTELPYVLQMLQTGKLTLVNPSSWDDKNDSYYIQKYKEKKSLGSVLALCLTEAPQTYHHWKVFTHGASGACVYFDKERFVAWLEEETDVVGRKVQYKTLQQIENTPPKVDQLPFLKRKAYEHEGEFRLLHRSVVKSVPTRSFDMPLNVIDHILLNPWLPPVTCTSLEKVIQGLPGCEDIGVGRATITKNDEWQKAADRAAT